MQVAENERAACDNLIQPYDSSIRLTTPRCPSRTVFLQAVIQADLGKLAEDLVPCPVITPPYSPEQVHHLARSIVAWMATGDKEQSSALSQYPTAAWSSRGRGRHSASSGTSTSPGNALPKKRLRRQCTGTLGVVR